MKHCPDCHAPNPPRLTRCYACGVLLDAAPKAVVKPGEETYPCLNCDGLVPYSAKKCPHCGKLFDAAPHLPKVLPPSDWEAEPLPDGTTRLHRRGWGRAARDLTPYVIFCMAAVYALAALFSGRRFPGEENPCLPWILLSPLLAVFVAGLAWMICGREEIRVGRDSLEQRLGLGRWQRVRRLSAGSFLVRSEWHGGRNPYYRHELVVVGQGVRLCLDMQTQSGGANLLMFRAEPCFPPELLHLGEFLASETGWTLAGPTPS